MSWPGEQLAWQEAGRAHATVGVADQHRHRVEAAEGPAVRLNQVVMHRVLHCVTRDGDLSDALSDALCDARW